MSIDKLHHLVYAFAAALALLVLGTPAVGAVFVTLATAAVWEVWRGWQGMESWVDLAAGALGVGAACVLYLVWSVR